MSTISFRTRFRIFRRLRDSHNRPITVPGSISAARIRVKHSCGSGFTTSCPCLTAVKPVNRTKAARLRTPSIPRCRQPLLASTAFRPSRRNPETPSAKSFTGIRAPCQFLAFYRTVRPSTPSGACRIARDGREDVSIHRVTTCPAPSPTPLADGTRLKAVPHDSSALTSLRGCAKSVFGYQFDYFLYFYHFLLA